MTLTTQGAPAARRGPRPGSLERTRFLLAVEAHNRGDELTRDTHAAVWLNRRQARLNRKRPQRAERS